MTFDKMSMALNLDFGDVETLAKQIGSHKIKITLTDEKGKKTVYDLSFGIISSKIIEMKPEEEMKVAVP